MEENLVRRSFNPARKVPRRGKKSSKNTTTATSNNAADSSAAPVASPVTIRHSYAILCQKIVSYKFAISEFVNSDDLTEAIIPTYINALLNEIQNGISSLHQDLANIVADPDCLTEKETRQLYGLICDLERQLQLCKKQKRAAVKSAKIRIQTAKLRSAREEFTEIPEIVPEKVQGKDALIQDTDKDKEEQPETELSLPELEDNNDKDNKSNDDVELDSSRSRRKSINLDESINSLPIIDKPLDSAHKRTMMQQPPIKFQRQQSNMGYPFSSCFPTLPAAPKNRMPATSSIPKASRELTMFPRERSMFPSSQQREQSTLFPRERSTMFPSQQRDRGPPMFPRERTMFPRHHQSMFPLSPRESRYTRHLTRGKTKLL